MRNAPRYFYAAMPTPEETEGWATRLAAAGVLRDLGRRVFPIQNWHQTLSDVHEGPDEETLARLMSAGDLIAAHAVTLRFNRVRWSYNEMKERYYCTLYAEGVPIEFRTLWLEGQRALGLSGLADRTSHNPHITLSYDAGALHPTIHLIPIEWTIKEVLLLKGHGNPYRYEVIKRWPLLPPSGPQHQNDLFALG